jgi:hypothetical protein
MVAEVAVAVAVAQDGLWLPIPVTLLYGLIIPEVTGEQVNGI